ncbi:MAG: hypothetical protein KF835_06595 [Xanthobacteraceae bacterium]|nr:hypothetical protein [Xanthobacteraceae bacterium]
MKYRSLESNEIIRTIDELYMRISSRFPRSDLAAVCEELLVVAKETEAKSQAVNAPNFPLRAIIVLLIAAAGGVILFLIHAIQVKTGEVELVNLLQGLEAGTNLVIFLSVAVYFLFSLESRISRTRALNDLNELRSIVHVIDMHQFSKDPSELLSSDSTEGMTRTDLTRYLGYCSIMLSLGAKLAALYAQKLPDEIVIDAASDLQNVAGGLSLKIWQKIAILESYEDYREKQKFNYASI